MGKRELVIVLAFIGVGAVAYELTAPASPDHPARFSLSNFIASF